MSKEISRKAARPAKKDADKPCPFCGSSKIIYCLEHNSVECEDCACQGPWGGLGRGNAKRRAIKFWNKRREISPWIAVADELPDADQTVMIARLDWDGDPVGMGWLDGDTWRDIEASPLKGKRAPTHWMPLPEPPAVAQVVAAQPANECLSDYRVAFPNNPFAVELGITCGVEDRCRMVKSFTVMQCLDAMRLPGLEKTVRKACEVRLRKMKGSVK